MDTLPKLKCIVTGKERATNKSYLNQKATKANCTIEEYRAAYICKDALKLLREGKSVSDVRTALNSTATDDVSQETIDKALAFNGRQKTPKAPVAE